MEQIYSSQHHKANCYKMNEFSSINDIIVKLLQEKGWDKLVDILKIRKKWRECVGEYVALNSQPVKLKGRTLFIAVKNSALTAELKINEDLIKNNIKRETGIKIDNIKFFIKREREKKENKTKIPSIGKPEAEKLKKTTNKVKDEELKSLFLRIIEQLEAKDA